MKKTILFFTGIFFMALIALVSCTPSPQEPDITSPQQPGDGNGETPQQPGDGNGETPQEPEVPSTEATNLDYQPNTINNYGNGNIASGTLDGNQEIQGSLYKLLYAGDTEVSFYEGGEFLSGTLVSGQTLPVGGDEGINIPFAMNTAVVSFHESGVISNVILASDQIVQIGGKDLPFEGGSEITFSPTGQIQSGRFTEGEMIPVGINKITFLTMVFSFYETGVVRMGALDSEQTLKVRVMGNDIPILFGSQSEITFSPTGQIQSGHFAFGIMVMVGINSILFDCFVKSIFHDNGVVASGQLWGDHELEIGGGEMEGGYALYFRSVSQIFFHENGEVKSGRLTQSQMSGNISFPSGNVNFDEDGAYLPIP